MNYYIMIANLLASEGQRTDEDVRGSESAEMRWLRKRQERSSAKKRRTESARSIRGSGKSLKSKCAEKANAARAKGASAGQAQVIYNKCMRAGGDSGDDPSGRAKRVMQGGSPFHK